MEDAWFKHQQNSALLRSFQQVRALPQILWSFVWCPQKLPQGFGHPPCLLAVSRDKGNKLPIPTRQNTGPYSLLIPNKYSKQCVVACGGIKILVLLLAGQLRLQRALWLRCVGVPQVHRFILRARILINGGSSMLGMQRGRRESTLFLN